MSHPQGAIGPRSIRLFCADETSLGVVKCMSIRVPVSHGYLRTFNRNAFSLLTFKRGRKHPQKRFDYRHYKLLLPSLGVATPSQYADLVFRRIRLFSFEMNTSAQINGNGNGGSLEATGSESEIESASHDEVIARITSEIDAEYRWQLDQANQELKHV
eukprot:1193986-Prorocentrum_minimum.AAC.1